MNEVLFIILAVTLVVGIPAGLISWFINDYWPFVWIVPLFVFGFGWLMFGLLCLVGWLAMVLQVSM